DPAAGGQGGKENAPESILYPKDNGGKQDQPAAGDKGEWKEYVPDPNKSAEENARLKAEHDKNKPADKSNDPADQVPPDGKYELTMPEGVEVDQELLSAMSPKLHAKGFTRK